MNRGDNVVAILMFMLIFIVPGCVCLCHAWYVRKDAKRFEMGCQLTKGTVTGYKTISLSAVNMIVRFFDGEKEVTQEIETVSVLKMLPIGTEINIAYQKGVYGCKSVKARWVRDEDKSVAHLDYQIAWMLCVIGIVAILMGIVVIELYGFL